MPDHYAAVDPSAEPKLACNQLSARHIVHSDQGGTPAGEPLVAPTNITPKHCWQQAAHPLQATWRASTGDISELFKRCTVGQAIPVDGCALRKLGMLVAAACTSAPLKR